MFSQIGVQEAQTMNSSIEAEARASTIHITESEEISSLRLSFRKQSEAVCEIISKSMNVGHDISEYFNDIINLSFMEDSADKVRRMQKIFYEVMESVINFYSPYQLNDLFTPEDGKLAIQAVAVANEPVTVPIDKDSCNGFYSVTADFENWEFYMTREDTVKLSPPNIEAENSLPADVLQDPYKPNLKDWYFLYGGKCQLINCFKQHKNEDLYLKSDGSIATRFSEGFVVDHFRGWWFTSETLDELIQLLCDDDFNASFSDDQNAICVRGGGNYGL